MSSTSEAAIRARLKYSTLPSLKSKCQVAGLSAIGTSTQLVDRLVAHELKKSSPAARSTSSSVASPRRTEAQVKAKYASMGLMAVRSECTKKGLSTYGTKEQMVARLVAKDKPPGGWASPSSTTSSAAAAAGSPRKSEAQVKAKYLAMTLMQVRLPRPPPLCFRRPFPAAAPVAPVCPPGR
eukprot:COSAG04_NODE_2018_length_4992_cov_2.675455_2_plen_181_part_00